METTTSRASLSVLEQRLEAHFDELRRVRDDQAGANYPVFALEHGLGELELALLANCVKDAIARRHLPTVTSLPFVVYAAEFGYGYAGDEYWQTFSQRTPGWSAIEDRDFVRRAFQRFAEKYRGAVPSGPWARQFSIICWPITHAVLPMDLQHQLVQLIFEYRTGLTSELLADPPSLGRRLAARSNHASSRFRYFAQNTALLGQVAAALLAPENESSPFLEDATLERIVASLSKHHSAREWLRDAKQTANRVRTAGFRRRPQSAVPTSDEPRSDRLPRAADPGVFVQLSERGWTTHLQLPDLSLLSEQLPELHEHLRNLRVSRGWTRRSAFPWSASGRRPADRTRFVACASNPFTSVRGRLAPASESTARGSVCAKSGSGMALSDPRARACHGGTRQGCSPGALLCPSCACRPSN